MFAMKLVLLAISVSVCLLLLELAVRWLLPQYTPERLIWFQVATNGVALGLPSQTIRQRTPKGDYDVSISFNALGLRDPKHLRDSTQADWFLIGDSFAFGWGLPEHERYSNLLEAHLRTNGITSRVFNIAVPENIIGYQRLLAYGESNGAKVRHVIVGICMENDLRDYVDGRTMTERDRFNLNTPGRKEMIKAIVRSHSALYVAASFTLQRFPFCRRLMEKVGIARNIELISGKNEWNPKLLEASRDQLLKVVASRDAIILIVPGRRLWEGDNMKTEDRVHETFVRLLREAGLRVVDMRPVFEKTGKPLAHYFKTDPHWNAQGHAAAATELFRAVQALQSSNSSQ